ncbi:MAG: RHS repeat-associated core domain-containing protein [Anaerohalosphaeraceae bacterium]
MVSYMYDGFGNVRAVSGTADNPYGFRGEQQLGEADDLVFLRARYYKPSIGRFISRDPIFTPMQIGPFVGWVLPYTNLLYHPQSLNPYVYVQNNPVILIDPTGLSSECDVFVCYGACAKIFGKVPSKALDACMVGCWELVAMNPNLTPNEYMKIIKDMLKEGAGRGGRIIGGNECHLNILIIFITVTMFLLRLYKKLIPQIKRGGQMI